MQSQGPLDAVRRRPAPGWGQIEQIMTAQGVSRAPAEESYTKRVEETARGARETARDFKSPVVSHPRL